MLADIGFGISQLIPIIIAASLHGDKTVIIEEPELNLHPRFQSMLSDMFVESYNKYNKRFLIETHSEYLIRKIQYLTAKQDLKVEDSVIYYLAGNDSNLESVEKIKKIRVQRDGSLSDNFGKGFYDEAIHWQLELLYLKNKN